MIKTFQKKIARGHNKVPENIAVAHNCDYQALTPICECRRMRFK